jgi:hypothetical protein
LVGRREQLWTYFTDEGGGNGTTWEIGFLRIASTEDAPRIAAQYNERYSKESPFGFTKPDTVPESLVHEVIEEMEEPPLATHVMPTSMSTCRSQPRTH